MVDITETCKPQSGWKSVKFFEFVKLHSAEARDLIGVGFLSGLTEDEAARLRRKWKAWAAGLSADEKARWGQAISDGLNLRPADEKARRGQAISDGHKARTHQQKAATDEKRKATMKRNGTSRARKRKVSERTLYAEFCVRLSTDVM
jgi:hypothetical protein